MTTTTPKTTLKHTRNGNKSETQQERAQL